MKVEVREGWDALRPLAAEWSRLLPASRADSVFLTWEWIDAWRQAGGEKVRPLVVVARDAEGSLAGIAPFYRWTYRLLGAVPYRTLRILGDFGSGADYLDWILRKDCEEAASEALARALIAQRGWDGIWIPSVAGWTGAGHRIVHAARSAGLHCRERSRDFAAIALPGDYATYLQSLGANGRSSLKRRTREVFGSKGASFVQCRSEEERPEYLEALFELHQRSRKAAGDEGAFERSPFMVRFYTHFTRTALSRGWLRLFGLKFGSEFKAVQIGYVYGGVFHQLQEGFDPAVAGIGNVLRAKVIEECIESGVLSYDFLAGVTEHKQRWRATTRLGCDLFLGRRSLKNLPVFSAGIWPTGRYLRPAATP
jgi:CelD/BcsL family acetyltransferase involved in cellulose biosynthesis